MIEKDPKFIIDSTSSHVEYRPSSLVNKPTAIVLPELSPYQSSMTKPLGELQLDVPVISPVEKSASDLFPGLPLGLLPPGTPDPLPVDVNQNIPDPPADNPNYDYFVFKSGQMSLTIENSFPFAMRFLTDVQLKNADLGQAAVATFQFVSDISPGQSVTKTSDVSGKMMSANLNMSFSIRAVNVAGSTLTSSSKITAQLSIDPIPPAPRVTMSSARVKFDKDQPVDSIPKAAVQIVDDTTGTPTKIKRAEFKDGRFRIRITNNIATRIAAFFKLPEFVDRITGAPFQLNGSVNDTVFIPARDSTTVNQLVELKDYAIQSQDIVGRDTLSVRDVNYSLSIKALKSTVGKVLITDSDYVTVEIIPEKNSSGNLTYVLSKVEGKVKPTPVPIDETVPAAIGDIGTKFAADSIKFDSVSITLKILSTGSFPTDLKMRIIGLDKNLVRRDSMDAKEVKGGVLTDTLRIYPGLEKKIVFDKTTSTLDAFLSSFFVGGSGNLPQQFIVTGQALVDPMSYYQYPESTGTVKVGDSVFTSVEFKFPVRVGIVNGTYRDTISLSDTSGNKIDTTSLSQIDSGKVIFTIFNGFPLQLDVGTKLLKSKSDTTVLLLLPKSGEIKADSARYSSKAPPIDNQIGKTATVIGLTTDDVNRINPATFIAVAIKMKTAGNNNPVEFKKDYYVHLKAFVSVKFNVNFDKLK
jgi:hypothetical protein